MSVLPASQQVQVSPLVSPLQFCLIQLSYVLPMSLQCQAKSVDATLWCCGFADASPGGDMRSSLDAFAAVLDQLAPSLALDLPSKVPVTAVTKALNVLKKKSTLPSDMYI